MEKVFKSLMVKPVRIKGFTLIESLFVLSIMLTMSLFAIGYYHRYDASYFNEINTIYLCQSESLKTKQKQKLSDYLDDGHTQVSFNAYGNINQASTYHYQNQTYVFQLGMGRFYVAN